MRITEKWEWWWNTPDILAYIKDVLLLPFDFVKISLNWVNDILEVVNKFLIKTSLILKNDLHHEKFLSPHLKQKKIFHLK